jgi:hypothetical protein
MNVLSEIVTLAALLKSPRTLNTNARKRCFGVGRLQIVFLQPLPPNILSLVPCRAKRQFMVLSNLRLFVQRYECRNQIVILAALLESHTMLNTNGQERRFGVQRLQIVCEGFT